MATFGDFPEQVWFDPAGVTNILSLHAVSKYYVVTYDSQLDNVFHIHNGRGDTYGFAPTGPGLYGTNVPLAYNGLSSMLCQEMWPSTLNKCTRLLHLPDRCRT